jgi:hypothetical protein
MITPIRFEEEDVWKNLARTRFEALPLVFESCSADQRLSTDPIVEPQKSVRLGRHLARELSRGTENEHENRIHATVTRFAIHSLQNCFNSGNLFVFKQQL